ncbi:cyclin-dependent kinase 11B-like isoform X3 [Mya arenaria]|uniref:cyclin-dependent kinase 11B-like isoform X3 n=1 Tax=Mya arenaria TaxID=6604 RepID=UPI0022E2DE40|nr:cyclin-dependent kinase 11B-like isoform X3 [Mya arenaria]
MSRKVTLVSDHSPYEQGELASSSPEQSGRSPEETEDSVGEDEQHSDQHMESEEDHDDDDGLLIKPPPVPVKKKHKHKHKDEKKKDKHKERVREGKEKDRTRGRVERQEREVRPAEREERGRVMYDFVTVEPERHAQPERAKIMSGRERERELKEKLLREQEKRERSRQERERLERLERDKFRQEREKLRERKIREERDKRDYERRKRKDEERRLQMQRKEREEVRNRKVRAMEKEQNRDGQRRDRSHGREQESFSDGRDVKARLGSRQSEQDLAQRERKPTPDRRERERDREHSHSHSSPDHGSSDRRGRREGSDLESRKVKAAAKETMEEEMVEHSPSEEEEEVEETDDSESDSGSEASESSSEGSSEGEKSHEDHEDEEKKHLAKSKFDDQSENESETESVHLNDHHDDGDFLTETPPMSPVELKPELPPYYPAIQGCRSVEEFSCLNRIEEGTYGVVYRARDKKTEEIVALKRLKMEKEKEGFPITSLREINTLLKAQHTNIVTVREIVVGSNMDKIYIVMDYVEHDLKALMTESMKQPFLVGEAKTLLLQLLRGVQHLHDNWIIHRDLKTSNLLLSHKGILKIGDFGLAREYGEPLKQYTPIVVTLWYRAPELLLGCKEYSTPIDMWSVGCIFAEFLVMQAIWQGKSEIDQLQKIFKDLGTPTEKIWPGLMELPGMKKCSFAEYPYNTLRNKFGQYLSDQGFNLLNRFLTYNPAKRITAAEGIKHEYFRESPLPIDPSMFPTWPAKSEQVHKRASSPKPPSGGKAYSKLLEDIDAVSGGFQFTAAAKGASAIGPGFSLKF